MNLGLRFVSLFLLVFGFGAGVFAAEAEEAEGALPEIELLNPNSIVSCVGNLHCNEDNTQLLLRLKIREDANPFVQLSFATDDIATLDELRRVLFERLSRCLDPKKAEAFKLNTKCRFSCGDWQEGLEDERLSALLPIREVISVALGIPCTYLLVIFEKVLLRKQELEGATVLDLSGQGVKSTLASLIICKEKRVDTLAKKLGRAEEAELSPEVNRNRRARRLADDAKEGDRIVSEIEVLRQLLDAPPEYMAAGYLALLWWLVGWE